LIEYFGLSPVLANEIAYCLGFAVSYIAHTTWSFSSKLDTRSLLRFLAVTFFGFILTGLISAAVHYVGGSYWLGILLVVLIIPPVTFSLHSIWTYRH
jgi:putative flippase GtrA